MLNALRLTEGVAPELFEARTGCPLAVVETTLRSLRARGLLREGRLATTPIGFAFLDRVVAEFLA